MSVLDSERFIRRASREQVNIASNSQGGPPSEDMYAVGTRPSRPLATSRTLVQPWLSGSRMATLVPAWTSSSSSVDPWKSKAMLRVEALVDGGGNETAEIEGTPLVGRVVALESARWRKLL